MKVSPTLLFQSTFRVEKFFRDAMFIFQQRKYLAHCKALQFLKYSDFFHVPETVKQKNDDIVLLRKELKEREETIQQREIDISCLRGQVKQALDDLEDDEEDSDTLTYACSDSEVFLDDLSTDTEDVVEELEKDEK